MKDEQTDWLTDWLSDIQSSQKAGDNNSTCPLVITSES